LLGMVGCAVGIHGLGLCEGHGGSHETVKADGFAVEHSEPVSIKIHTTTGHIVMPAWIEGDGPYWFVLDTGNQNTTIFADLAAELELETKPLGEMGGAGSGSITVLQANNVRVGLGAQGGQASFVDQMVTVLPNAAKLPPFGDKEIVGFLGATTIERFVTSIDYEHDLLIFHDQDEFKVAKDAKVMEMKLAFGFPYFEGTVTPRLLGEPVEPITGSFLLDLGDSNGIGIEFEQAKTARLVHAEDPDQTLIGKGRGIDGVEFMLMSAPLESSVMGGMEMDDEVVSFSTTPGGGPPIPNLVGTVGSGSFPDKVVTLDYKNGRLILTD
ncbi:MAG: aspartyl protease family protein, partial [Phycisphaerales bacterium]|nr:aspartyl protease family protein [Phycisphaerales bacterium]